MDITSVIIYCYLYLVNSYMWPTPNFVVTKVAILMTTTGHKMMIISWRIIYFWPEYFMQIHFKIPAFCLAFSLSNEKSWIYSSFSTKATAILPKFRSVTWDECMRIGLLFKAKLKVQHHSYPQSVTVFVSTSYQTERWLWRQ